MENEIKQNVLNLVAQKYGNLHFMVNVPSDKNLFKLQENVAKDLAKIQIYNDYKDKPEVMEKYFKAIDEL